MNELSNNNAHALMRQLPSVDTLLQQAQDLVENYGHQAVTGALRMALSSLREAILAGETPDLERDDLAAGILASVRESLARNEQSSLVAVFNLTGTVLHTNLGRALLPTVALDAVTRAAAAPVNLEYDLGLGERGERDSHVESLVCELTGAEAAAAVNNNAAAVLLVLNTLARNREVPVSRGELVEIGGSFRIPDVMERSGCKLVETGTTNRTHLKDYEKAINNNTALLMKVHTSNYRIDGFTATVTEHELAGLARKYALPLVIDMGSGSLADLAGYGLPAEPTVSQVLHAGADLVTFSGDKLLGGPQCGIVAGRRELVEQIRRNPLKRALRLDKMILAALAAVLRLYRNPELLATQLPTLRLLTRSVDDIQAQAERLLPLLQDVMDDNYAVSIEQTSSQIGSGAIPVEGIPSRALAFTPVSGRDEDVRQLARIFRALPTPVIGRVFHGRVILDLRCLEQEQEFLDQLTGLAGTFQ